LFLVWLVSGSVSVSGCLLTVLEAVVCCSLPSISLFFCWVARPPFLPDFLCCI
jgi:hypothetical protein